MGKREDRQNLRQDNHGGRASRKARYGYLAALVTCGLAVPAALSIGCTTPERQVSTSVTIPVAIHAATAGKQAAAQDEASKTFRQDRAWTDLIKQCAFGPRKPGTVAHKACRDYIADEMKKTCDDVRFQQFSHVWTTTNQPITMWNIVGNQNWKNATVKVVLVAHWDTRPTADQERDAENRAKPIPGADDGASEVAVLLELARVLKGALPPSVGIEYVMTDGEDLGPGEDEMYLGAEVYAKSIPKATYGILLDMIGAKHLLVPKEVFSVRAAPKLMDAIYAHASKLGLSTPFPNTMGEEIDDDHIPLIKAGLPTIDLIDFEGYMPYWHTLQDTPEQCSPESLGQVGKLLQTWLQKPEPFTTPK